KESTLLEVRSLLSSRHQVQRREEYTVCEICSFCLVQSLIRQYGRPPSADCPDAPLPDLPSSYVHHLARGLILGAGDSDTSRITCTGPLTAIRELQQLVQVATGVSAPLERRIGKAVSITWTVPEEVKALAAWLHL